MTTRGFWGVSRRALAGLAYHTAALAAAAIFLVPLI